MGAVAPVWLLDWVRLMTRAKLEMVVKVGDVPTRYYLVEHAHV